MSFLHIANTNFEAELISPTTVAASIQAHPIFLQLQFLPLLYREPGDGIAVTHLPYPNVPNCHLLTDKQFLYDKIESWGASPTIAAWAKLPYKHPDFEIVKQVNSKAFSFEASPKLPGAALIHSMEEVQRWEQKTEGPRVLKTCFGVSGKGHLFLPSAHVKKFAEKEFSAGRPLIAEPWVDRKFDFSTQWILHPDQSIDYVGATVLLSDPRGRYTANHVGNLPILFGKYFPLLEKHREIVFPILQKMASLGYFGNVGIDAMIWGDDHLHPVVEINARKTMGWVALEILKRRFTKQTIALSYLSVYPRNKENLMLERAKNPGLNDRNASCINLIQRASRSFNRGDFRAAPTSSFPCSLGISRLDNLLPDSVVQKNGDLIRFSKKLVVEQLAK